MMRINFNRITKIILGANSFKDFWANKAIDPFISSALIDKPIGWTFQMLLFDPVWFRSVFMM